MTGGVTWWYGRDQDADAPRRITTMTGSRLAVLACALLAGGALAAAAVGPSPAASAPARSHESAAPRALDDRVRAFLARSRGKWRDLNVPYEDGQVLHDLVVRKGFQRGLEIGTSTGHSTIWIAWAMSQTGGRLTTIEIDERRHQTALANIEEAGLAPFVDARLADAHQLVKELAGPFDFVFSDADKEWYTQYFKDVDPKLAAGGCFTAHNVARSNVEGIREFLDYVRSRPNYQTTVDRTSSEGISISCKTKHQAADPTVPGRLRLARMLAP
jgi:predicted O-methyltransferase YrrM